MHGVIRRADITFTILQIQYYNNIFSIFDHSYTQKPEYRNMKVFSFVYVHFYIFVFALVLKIAQSY